MMRTEEPRPVRLKDYRPPDWLIETVALDVSLDATATTVRSKLTIRPNMRRERRRRSSSTARSSSSDR